MNILKKTQARIVKETVHLWSEHSKATLVRSKLKSLHRELQHHNKTLKVSWFTVHLSEVNPCFPFYIGLSHDHGSWAI